MPASSKGMSGREQEARDVLTAVLMDSNEASSSSRKVILGRERPFGFGDSPLNILRL